MARRTVLTSRQRSVLFSLPQHEADLLHHYTLSEEDLHGWEHINLTGEYRWPGADPRSGHRRLT